MQDWLVGNWRDVAIVPISLVLLYAVILVTHRAVGLRSYSKMSGTDFVTTVATGSLLGASIASPQPSVLMTAVGLICLFSIMLTAAWAKRSITPIQRIIENKPLLLMDRGQVLKRNLDRSNITLDELHGKLRENNVWNYDQVIAVVFEPTGDMSVIARGGTDLEPEPRIFADVRVRP